MKDNPSAFQGDTQIKPCLWNGRQRPCYLFARKFFPDTLEALLHLFPNYTSISLVRWLQMWISSYQAIHPTLVHPHQALSATTAVVDHLLHRIFMPPRDGFFFECKGSRQKVKLTSNKIKVLDCSLPSGQLFEFFILYFMLRSRQKRKPCKSCRCVPCQAQFSCAPSLGKSV